MNIHSHAQRRGVALVLVLAFLVLISVFVVGFFVSATSELSASSGFAATVSAQQLSDSATNIVMGQIREATTRPGEVWASQPGMIRTFRSDSPQAFYKLYSSDKMVIEGPDKGSVGNKYNPYSTSAGSLNTAEVPVGGSAGWNHKPAIFVNLNDPVRVAVPGSQLGVSGTLGPDYQYRYPILDPTAFYLRESDATAGSFLPTSLQPPPVEGAELIRNTSDDSDNDPNGKDKKTVYSRMPVRWLYVLKDGTTTSPGRDLNGTMAIWDADDSKKATTPSADNPIVGRMAFWTDDDTCKVNINTAGGFSNFQTNSPKTEDAYAGSFWDTPRFSTLFDEGRLVSGGAPDINPGDVSLALGQPVRNEFQRYPGHPSTTSLGLVFKGLLTSSQIYALTPRLNGGGSEGGTKRILEARGGSPIAIKNARLYSSVDEMLFAPPATNPAGTTTTDALTDPRRLNTNEIKSTGLTPELVNRLRFFLTAHSRAPELNIFGRPRVTIWPLWPYYNPTGGTVATTYNALTKKGTIIPRTTFRARVDGNPTEKLIEFCSTIGPKNNDLYVRPYFFQRCNPYSATEDATIPRNKALLSYLTGLMGQPILGSGGGTVATPPTFQAKYPGETNDTDGSTANGNYRQIISEIFDYIRCVNLNDTSHDIPTPESVPHSAPGWVASNPNPAYPTYSPHSIVAPSIVDAAGGAPGFGRFPTISEAVLVFYNAGYAIKNPPTTSNPRFTYATVHGRKLFREGYTRTNSDGSVSYRTGKNKPDGSPDPNEVTPLGGTYIGSFMRAFVMFESFNPMQGYSAQTSFGGGQLPDASPTTPFTDEIVNRGLYFQHALGDDGWANLKVNFDGIKTDGYLNFPSLSGSVHGKNKTTFNRFWNVGASLGGLEGFFHMMYFCGARDPLNPSSSSKPGATDQYYPFQSTPVFPPPSDGTDATGQYFMDYSGTKVYIRPFDLSGIPGVFVPRFPAPDDDPTKEKEDLTKKVFSFAGGIASLKISFAGTTVNTLQLNFPPTNAAKKEWWPIPTDNLWVASSGGFPHEGPMGLSDGSNPNNSQGALQLESLDQGETLAGRIRWVRQGNHVHDPKVSSDKLDEALRYQQLLQPGDTIRSLVPFNPNGTLITTDEKLKDKGMGDPRALALIGNTNSVQGRYLQPHPYYNVKTGGDPDIPLRDVVHRHAQGLRDASMNAYIGGATGAAALDPDIFNPKFVSANPPFDVNPSNKVFETHFGRMTSNLRFAGSALQADLPPNVTDVLRGDKGLPDYDTGLSSLPDGGYLNKSDEGSGGWRNWIDPFNGVPGHWAYGIPYYNENEGGYNTLFSPNKQMPSAVQFGSLLAGRTKHWQTLCFCPNPAGSPHPGIIQEPKDHFLLDLFTMPVVEPYAISEPLSTAGKVNLNYAMAPFSHIRRSTAMRAILHPVRVTAIPNVDANVYKLTSGIDSNEKRSYRFRIDRDETLKAFDYYFYGKPPGGMPGPAGDPSLFRTGSQICEMYLYPNLYMTEAASSSGARLPRPEFSDLGNSQPTYKVGNQPIRDLWTGHAQLTGDNLREKPYNDIYPRITTKSNTYTVHMWVQALRKSSTAGLSAAKAEAAQRTWDETKDQVVAEYRGSNTIERYIDPEDRRFDPTNSETKSKTDSVDPDKTSLESLYRFRVVESKRFAP